MPTPEARKGTTGSSGQIAGRPITQSAPSTGPTRAPMPPITTMATTRTDSSGANVAAGVLLGSRVTSRHPASAAMPPDTANASSFMRVVEMVIAEADVGLSLTAMVERPMPVRRNCATTATHTMRNARHR